MTAPEIYTIACTSIWLALLFLEQSERGWTGLARFFVIATTLGLLALCAR